MKKDTPLIRAKATIRYTTCSISIARVVSMETEVEEAEGGVARGRLSNLQK